MVGPRRRIRPWQVLLPLAGLGSLLVLACAGRRGETPYRSVDPAQASPAGLPVGGGSPQSQGSLGLPALEWDTGVAAHRWRSIVLHHSGTERGSAESFGSYHQAMRGWRSLGYHFVIGNGTDVADGEIQAGPRWRLQEAGAHANSYEYNHFGIGICLVGNFEKGPPTPRQVESLRRLVEGLCRRFGLSRQAVYPHGQVREGGSTVCPGRYFDLAAVLGP